MKTYKELLTLVRDTLLRAEKNYGVCGGMCLTIHHLRVFNLISYDEELKIKNFIQKNRPHKGQHYNKNFKYSAYWWLPGDIKSRVSWLNSKIKQL